MDDRGALLAWAAAEAARYRAELADRRVQPEIDDAAVRAALGDLTDAGVPAADAVRQLADAISSVVTATAGPRYFGFVVGSALDIGRSRWSRARFAIVRRTPPQGVPTDHRGGCGGTEQPDPAHGAVDPAAPPLDLR